MSITLGDLIERHVKDEGEKKTRLLRWYRDKEKELKIAEERLRRATERKGKVEEYWIWNYGCSCELHGITCTHENK